MKNIYQKTFQHTQSLWVNYHCDSNTYFESHKSPGMDDIAVCHLLWKDKFSFIVLIEDIDWQKSMPGFIEKWKLYRNSEKTSAERHIYIFQYNCLQFDESCDEICLSLDDGSGTLVFWAFWGDSFHLRPSQYNKVPIENKETKQ